MGQDDTNQFGTNQFGNGAGDADSGDHIPLEPIAETPRSEATKPTAPAGKIGNASLLAGQLTACPGCGHRLGEHDVVCTNCGLDLRVGRRRDVEVGEVEVEERKAREEFLAPTTLSPKVHAAIGAGFLVLALVLTAVYAPRGSTLLAIGLVLSTLYNTLVHTGTGVVAVILAAMVFGAKMSRFDFAAARMFLAFSAFQLVSVVQVPGIPAGLSKFLFALVAGGVYLLALMLLMRKSKEQAVAIAAFHFALWLLYSGGVWLSAWVTAEAGKLPPTP